MPRRPSGQGVQYPTGPYPPTHSPCGMGGGAGAAGSAGKAGAAGRAGAAGSAGRTGSAGRAGRAAADAAGRPTPDSAPCSPDCSCVGSEARLTPCSDGIPIEPFGMIPSFSRRAIVMARLVKVLTTPSPTPMRLLPTPTTPYTTDKAVAAALGAAIRPFRPLSPPRLARGSPGRARSPGRPPGAPPPPDVLDPPEVPDPATAREADGWELAPGAITFAADSVDGLGTAGAAAGSGEGAAGFGVSGIRTDARRSHPAPHVPPPGTVVETELIGVAASAAPSTAAAAAPMAATLMTDLQQSTRLARVGGHSLRAHGPRRSRYAKFHCQPRWVVQLTDTSRYGRGRQSDDRGRLMQAFCPFGIGIRVGGDAAADPQHCATYCVELDGADRDIELAPG